MRLQQRRERCDQLALSIAARAERAHTAFSSSRERIEQNLGRSPWLLLIAAGAGLLVATQGKRMFRGGRRLLAWLPSWPTLLQAVSSAITLMRPSVGDDDLPPPENDFPPGF